MYKDFTPIKKKLVLKRALYLYNNNSRIFSALVRGLGAELSINTD